MTIQKYRRTRDEIVRDQELRRSSAASRHRNKAKYTRKTKHKEYYV